MLSNVVGNVAPNQTREIIKEIKLSKVCDEEDSPDFPIFLEVKTIDNLISDIKNFLDSSEDIAGIVCNQDSTMMVIKDTKHLPKEADVDVVVKKGKHYIRMS